MCTNGLPYDSNGIPFSKPAFWLISENIVKYSLKLTRFMMPNTKINVLRLIHLLVLMGWHIFTGLKITDLTTTTSF